ncbi:hypothetical protein IC229_31660 [Spirosoma sp. BT702]|uniref:Uncharacterized protein n=1 Tax=Spirosoma profusum TaxID=2771354 RepID=A0A927AVM2_9BACT|nr:hypothetical protein [Spirosoma profusum]MBD2705221.1 hypothetical protein [Spirosoma profusum]
MKTLLCLPIALATLSVYAQAPDSTKARPANSLSKFEQPSQFGVSQPQTTTSTAPSIKLPSTPNKKIKSEYQYENGKIVGGKTTLFESGKKKN